MYPQISPLSSDLLAPSLPVDNLTLPVSPTPPFPAPPGAAYVGVFQALLRIGTLTRARRLSTADSLRDALVDYLAERNVAGVLRVTVEPSNEPNDFLLTVYLAQNADRDALLRIISSQECADFLLGLFSQEISIIVLGFTQVATGGPVPPLQLAVQSSPAQLSPLATPGLPSTLPAQAVSSTSPSTDTLAAALSSVADGPAVLQDNRIVAGFAIMVVVICVITFSVCYICRKRRWKLRAAREETAQSAEEENYVKSASEMIADEGVRAQEVVTALECLGAVVQPGVQKLRSSTMNPQPLDDINGGSEMPADNVHVSLPHFLEEQQRYQEEIFSREHDELKFALCHRSSVGGVKEPAPSMRGHDRRLRSSSSRYEDGLPRSNERARVDQGKRDGDGLLGDASHAVQAAVARVHARLRVIGLEPSRAVTQPSNVTSHVREIDRLSRSYLAHAHVDVDPEIRRRAPVLVFDKHLRRLADPETSDCTLVQSRITRTGGVRASRASCVTPPARLPSPNAAPSDLPSFDGPP